MKKNLFKKITAAMLAAVMAVNVSAPVYAETISDYEAEITENGKTVCCITIELNEESMVTDPVLLEQLNSLLEDNANARSYPTASWPNAREYDLTNGSTYTERINMANGDYYSPSFLVELTSSLASKFYLEAITLDNNLATTYYLYTSIYLYSNTTQRWYESERKSIGFNEVFYYKALFNGTQNPDIGKVALKFYQGGSEEGAIAYSVWHT